MKPNAADVIAQGVRRSGEKRSMRTLQETARELETLVPRGQWPEGVLATIAAELRARHDHADPCDDENCSCYKAARDWIQDQGRGTP